VAAIRSAHRDRLLLIAGGPHASADPQGTLALGFDVAFVGEGERSLAAFVRALASGGGGPACIRDPGPPLDLDEQWHVDPRLQLYPFAEISRGCPHACAFCQVPAMFGRRMRHRSPAVVGQGLEQAVRAGFRRFRFLTPDAFAYRGGGGSPRQALGQLLQEGRRAGANEMMLGTFPSEVRPDRVREGLLQLVDERCTNRTLVIGAQSGSDRVLGLMHRGHTVEDSRRAVAATAAIGLKPHVDVLFGFPGETAEERLQTLAFAGWCVESARARIHAHVFMPLPGTPAWPKAPEKLEPGLIADLRRLQEAKVLDGDWVRQEMHGRRILRWRDEGRIRV
jgi:B12-binding domain/radical SAM domain protein